WLTLDPAAAFDTVSLIAVGNVYESLVTFANIKHPDDIVPFLASAVPTRENGLLSADGRSYRFPLRKDVRFHDGSLMTPEDVRYSLLRFLLEDPPGGPAGLLLEPVLGVPSTRRPDGRLRVSYRQAARAVRVEGDSVVVRLKRPDEAFLKVLASLPVVVPKAWCASHGEWDGGEASWKRFNGRRAAPSYLDSHMDGTGPFTLAKVEPGRELVFARNDRYWRKPAALTQVYFRVVRNAATRLWMLENGDADSTYLEDQDYQDAAAIPGVRIIDPPYHTSLGETLFFTFRADPASPFLGSGRLDGQGVPPDFFSDADVRRGFAASFDYDGYLSRGLGGRGLRAPSAFPASLLPSQPPTAPAFDVAAARAAFKKAWKGRVWGQGFTLTLVFNPSS
ncbi:MAG: ABC transporter substrate-binding protein, partial [Elusimicrobia bacterium]|nr:ABC transporter substrate-binding protein [Elusimicrobiota bacterium]